MTSPVVVAGAGGAGLAAALSAAQCGVDTVVLEANLHYRHACTTVMSTGLVPGAGTPAQQAANVDDSPEDYAADILAKTGETSDPVTTATLTARSAELVEWLGRSLRRALELATDARYPGHRRHRLHAPADRSGRTLHGALNRAVIAHDVEVLMPYRLVGVAERTDALRLTVATPDGARHEMDAGALVLATGGFAQDPELVRRHLPQLEAATYFGGDHSDGQALRLAEELGLDCAYLDSYTGHASYAHNHGVLVTWNAVMHGGVIVNTAGRRFADESIGYSGFADALAGQEASRGFLLLDQRIADACKTFPEFTQLRDAGGIRWADDPVALARAIGVPETVLGATLEEAGIAATGAHPDPHGRTDWEAPLAWPVGVIPISPILGMSQGGLVTDEQARVRRDGRAVPRLYAAGGAATGTSGHGGEGYLAGNGLLLALGLGYIAGRDAARVVSHYGHRAP
ncbi:MAG: FAD-binding protein [Propionibacteriales bacterium]|nr:FAD-binding protein [Propionibacteriales bacterium]